MEVRPAVDEAAAGTSRNLAAPTLVFAGGDWRHPAALATALAERLPLGRLGRATMSDTMRTTEDFARAFAPEIAAFLHDAWPRG